MNGSRWLRRVALVPLALLLVVVGFLAQTWTNLPKRSAERFIALLAKQDVAGAAALLDASSSIAVADGGGLAISAADGSKATLLASELPLVALVTEGVRVRRGLGDHLAGRFRFQMTPKSFAPRDGRASPIEVECLAVRETVTIESIR